VPPATRPAAWHVRQLEAISGHTVLVNCAGAALQSAAVAPPCGAGPVAGAPLAVVLEPPPQAPSRAVATQAKSSAPVRRKVGATSDRIGFPLRIRELVGGTNSAAAVLEFNSAIRMNAIHFARRRCPSPEGKYVDAMIS